MQRRSISCAAEEIRSQPSHVLVPDSGALSTSSVPIQSSSTAPLRERSDTPMLIIKATWFATIGVLLSLFVVGAAWALPPRVSWEPARLAPASLAPGESATYSVTLIHTGFLPIPATKQLRIVPEGALAHYVTVIPPAFPPVLKRGDCVSVQVTVTAPTDAPLSVVRDELLLERVLPNGKTLEVFRAEALPVELTFSPFPLPPDPGEAGKATLAGIDSNNNGVRDDVERWIVLSFANGLEKPPIVQASVALQQTLTSSNELEAQQGGENLDRAIACLDARLGVDRARVAYGDLLEQMVDTELRFRADQVFRSRVRPGDFPEVYPNSGCEL